jgi:formylglycine-generating enzyme required for sulfatase activity
LEGIREIKERYIQLAEAAKQRGEWAKAQGYYEDALTIAPQDNTLVAALPEIEKEMRRTGMVPVPAGEFLMGSEDGDNDEKPVHRVYLDAFYIDKYEVTVAEYGRCVQGGRCSTPGTGVGCNWGQGGREDHPINCVDWNQAETYCEWAGKRLPPEAEWERAARGTDGRKYPWGDQWDSSKANAESRIGRTTSVGSYSSGVSPYGVHDMAGNVWEWVQDWYDRNYYQRGFSRNPKGPDSGSLRVLRGGSWGSFPGNARTSARGRSVPGTRYYDGGFRCAR